MTFDEIKHRIELIRAKSHDSEAAHELEDDLRWAFIDAIATGTCADPVKCAMLVLTTDDLDFCRWYS